MLGLGEDGHTASLFPGIAQEIEGNSLVEAAYAQSQAMWRLTITPKLINAARRVVFAVEGTQKARALAAVYEGPRDPMACPAQLVQPSSGELTWLVDEAAANLLCSKRVWKLGSLRSRSASPKQTLAEHRVANSCSCFLPYGLECRGHRLA